MCIYDIENFISEGKFYVIYVIYIYIYSSLIHLAMAQSLWP